MTAPTLSKLTESEEAILRSWLGGNTITDIAKSRRIDLRHVSRTIDRVCNFDRPRGRQILDTGEYQPFEYRQDPEPAAPRVPARVRPASPLPKDDDELVDEPAVKSTAVLDALTTPEPEPASAEPVKQPCDDTDPGYDANCVHRTPADHVSVNPDPEPEPVYETPATMSADTILTRAAQVHTPPVRAQIALIRRQLAELVGLLDQAQFEAEARALVEAKRRELAEAEERLRAVTGTPAPAAVRAWARENNLPCPPHGTPGRQLVERYKAALLGGHRAD